MEFYNYIVKEGYYGRNIEVSVHEKWSYDGIDGVLISCPKYGSNSRLLGHKCSEFVDVNGHAGYIVGGIVERLNVDDIRDAILNEIIIAEKGICKSLNKKYDDLKLRRSIDIITEYQNQKIIINLFCDICSDIVWIKFPSSSQLKFFSINDNEYRNAIIAEFDRCRVLIDNGYVFSRQYVFNVDKKKVKSLI